MEISPIDSPSDEREEGEIVEDDLEDVSDCSMSLASPFYLGKSVSRPELLSAVCLSSISSSECTTAGDVCDTESLPRERTQTRRRYHKRNRAVIEHSCKRKRNHQLRHRRKSTKEPDTESDSEVVDPKYAKKLQFALRRERSQDILHNSLRTRLKGFIEPSSQTDYEDDDDDGGLNLDALRDMALLSTLKSVENHGKPAEDSDCKKMGSDEGIVLEDPEKENTVLGTDSVKTKEGGGSNENLFENLDDSELRELRIAALKSFVMENHKRRKQKAATYENIIVEVSNNVDEKKVDEVNKENNTDVLNSDLNEKSMKNAEQNNSDFEIVLKELLPKTIEDDVSDVGKSLEEDADILRAMVLASMSEKLAGNSAEKNLNTKTLGFPRTLSNFRKIEKSHNSLSITLTKPQPLLKTVKNDLYTINNKNEKPQLLPTNVIVKPLIINVNGDSDSDTENFSNNSIENKSLKATVAEFLKKQRAEAEATVNKNVSGQNSCSESNNKSDDLLMEKSVMKLLPRSQQLEYRRLKQQLLNARMKIRIRRPSQRLSETRRENAVNTNVGKKFVKAKADGSNGSKGLHGKVIKGVGIDVGIKKLEPSTGDIQRTLSDLQVRRNGRLQMKGKYRSLAPLLHRINQASNERRQHEIEIKRLLVQIEKARTKLAASHQSFTTLVEQLLQQKNALDRCTFKAAKDAQINVFTSTPHRFIKKTSTCDISNVSADRDKSEMLRSSCEATNSINDTNNGGLVTNEIESAENNHNLRNESPKKEELLEPNDIDKVFVEEPLLPEITAVPKYTSPLDNRDGMTDPLTTICPYDLLGVCKDKECRYIHCS